MSLTPTTYFAVMGDILSSLHKPGFRRFLLVNGHGGNAPVQAFISQWLTEHEDAEVVFYHWWCAPQTLREVHSVDTVATHARKAASIQVDVPDDVVKCRQLQIGGRGGVIAIDGKGKVAMPFDTDAMYRGIAKV